MTTSIGGVAVSIIGAGAFVAFAAPQRSAD
jgi:hypothetical protein